MVGPPGAGKTMLARRLPGILPPPTMAEAIEITKVQGAAGLARGGLVAERPFRAPHHTISPVGTRRRERPAEARRDHARAPRRPLPRRAARVRARRARGAAPAARGGIRDGGPRPARGHVPGARDVRGGVQRLPVRETRAASARATTSTGSATRAASADRCSTASTSCVSSGSRRHPSSSRTAFGPRARRRSARGSSRLASCRRSARPATRMRVSRDAARGSAGASLRARAGPRAPSRAHDRRPGGQRGRRAGPPRGGARLPPDRSAADRGVIDACDSCLRRSHREAFVAGAVASRDAQTSLGVDAVCAHSDSFPGRCAIWLSRRPFSTRPASNWSRASTSRRRFVIGSRHPSEYGRTVAYRLGRGLGAAAFRLSVASHWASTRSPTAAASTAADTPSRCSRAASTSRTRARTGACTSGSARAGRSSRRCRRDRKPVPVALPGPQPHHGRARAADGRGRGRRALRHADHRRLRGRHRARRRGRARAASRRTWRPARTACCATVQRSSPARRTCSTSCTGSARAKCRSEPAQALDPVEETVLAHVSRGASIDALAVETGLGRGAPSARRSPASRCAASSAAPRRAATCPLPE